MLPKVLVADQRGGDGGGAGDQLDEHLGARVEDAEQQLERGEALLRLQERSRKGLGGVCESERGEALLRLDVRHALRLADLVLGDEEVLHEPQIVAEDGDVVEGVVAHRRRIEQHRLQEGLQERSRKGPGLGGRVEQHRLQEGLQERSRKGPGLGGRVEQQAPRRRRTWRGRHGRARGGESTRWEASGGARLMNR